jgi:hypothetical protein
MDSSVQDTTDHRAFRLNITVKPETKSRLDQARNRRGVEINVSQVCDRAINAELDRAENPALNDLVARLRVESDRRRGVPYRIGHAEGARWARETGSWAEVCMYGRMDESDVVLGDVTWTWTEDGERVRGQVLGFIGRFSAPEQDYARNTPRRWGAPCFVADDGHYERQPHLCDQYWRGWLAGVREVFAEASTVLEPVTVQVPQPVADNPIGEDVPASGDIDPDDILF